MSRDLINANPIIYGRKERRVRNAVSDDDEELEEEYMKIFGSQTSNVQRSLLLAVEHCSMATIIGLCLRVKLMHSLPSRFKIDIKLAQEVMQQKLTGNPFVNHFAIPSFSHPFGQSNNQFHQEDMTTKLLGKILIKLEKSMVVNKVEEGPFAETPEPFIPPSNLGILLNLFSD
ncbi:hypothetical protein HPP92_007650 [Vanilla planifolia]|uniref:Uncharacterized protein n=1 Tax=Vanilla planifolia TaxID=51239 RepID=A0A835RRT2_VANPL|nr:hypothetical protein HPP92_007650 [Vanilla planifolia]